MRCTGALRIAVALACAVAAWAHFGLATAADGNAVPRQASARRIVAEALVSNADELDLAKIEAAYHAALRAQPDYLPALLGLGMVREAQRDLRDAQKWLRLAQAKSKSGPVADAIRRDLNVLDGALQAASSPADRKEQQYLVQVERARIYGAIGQSGLAAKSAQYALDISEWRRWEGYAVGAQAALSVGRFEDALTLYRAAAMRAPEPQRRSLAGAIAGLSMPRQFTFGMPVGEANSRMLGPLSDVAWQSILRASEYPSNDVRYLRNQLAKFQNLPFVEIYEDCTNVKGALLVVLFNQERLFRVVMVFPSGCAKHQRYVATIADQLGLSLQQSSDGVNYFRHRVDDLIFAGVAGKNYSWIGWEDGRVGLKSVLTPW